MRKFTNEIMEKMAKELNVFQKEKKSASFIKQLIKVADHYDKKGMRKVANLIDDLLYVFANEKDNEKGALPSLEEATFWEEKDTDEEFMGQERKEEGLYTYETVKPNLEDYFYRRALRACRKAIQEGPSDDTRNDACLVPKLAFWYAKFIDKGPHKNTREGAMGNSSFAINYALEIDKGPHNDTREGALEDAYSAINYAMLVDKGFHQDTFDAVKGTSYEEEYKSNIKMP